MATDRVCAHCGCDKYKQEEFDRLLLRNNRLEKAHEREAAGRAVAVARHRLDELTWKDSLARLQSKIARQKRAIRRLEERLAFVAEKPHESVEPSEAVTSYVASED